MRKVEGDGKLFASLRSQRVEWVDGQEASFVNTVPAVQDPRGDESEWAPESDPGSLRDEEPIDEDWLMTANDDDWVEDEDDFDEFDDDDDDDDYLDEEDDLDDDDDFDDEDDEEFTFDEDED